MNNQSFENKIKELAEGGKIDPNPQVWDRLVIRKNVQEKKSRISFRKIGYKIAGIAASMIFGVTIHCVLLENDNVSVDKYAARNYVTAELSVDQTDDFNYKEVHKLRRAYGSYLTKKEDNKLIPKLKPKVN